MSRGYFAIGVYQPKSEINVGTLWRTANLMGASMLFTIGERYVRQASDTMNSDKHIPLVHFKTFRDMLDGKPKDMDLISVELDHRSRALNTFKHPDSAWYLLGAEDNGLPNEILHVSDSVLQIPSSKPYSMNVATAGSIVAYDRYVKGLVNG